MVRKFRITKVKDNVQPKVKRSDSKDISTELTL